MSAVIMHCNSNSLSLNTIASYKTNGVYYRHYLLRMNITQVIS